MIFRKCPLCDYRKRHCVITASILSIWPLRHLPCDYNLHPFYMTPETLTMWLQPPSFLYDPWDTYHVITASILLFDPWDTYHVITAPILLYDPWETYHVTTTAPFFYNMIIETLTMWLQPPFFSIHTWHLGHWKKKPTKLYILVYIMYRVLDCNLF